MRFKAAVTRRGLLRRVLSVGLPTMWGAVAITYKLTCPLAQENGLGARVATSAVFFAVGTGTLTLGSLKTNWVAVEVSASCTLYW